MKIRFVYTYMRSWVILATLGFLASTSGLEAQQPRLRAVLDSDSILLGDQLTLTLELTSEQPGSAVFPGFSDTLVAGIEVLITGETDSLKTRDGDHVFRRSYLITSFDSGQYTIPPLPALMIGETHTDTLFSNTLSLYVNTLPPDTSITFYDIKSPYGAPVSFREILPYLALGIVLSGTAVALLLYMRRRKRRQVKHVRMIPSDPPHIIALNALEELREQKLWQMGRVKAYHSRLTEIIRTYLEMRFSVRALEETSREILEHMEKLGQVEQESLMTLAKLLELADLVKFARFAPQPSENEQSMEGAIRFVKATYLEEPPQTAKEVPAAEPEKVAMTELVSGKVNEMKETKP